MTRGKRQVTDDSQWDALLDSASVTKMPPATSGELESAELALGRSLPQQLRELLLRSDGAIDQPGQWFVIWPLSRIVDENVGTDESWPGVSDTAIAFGDDGTGNPFVLGPDGSVSYRSPIDMEDTFLSADLVSFWGEWLEDRLPPH